jgi:hypothetical protein
MVATMRADRMRAAVRDAEQRELTRAAQSRSAVVGGQPQAVARRSSSSSRRSVLEGWVALAIGCAVWAMAEVLAVVVGPGTICVKPLLSGCADVVWGAAVALTSVILVLALTILSALRWCGLYKRVRLIQFARLPRMQDWCGVLLAYIGVATVQSPDDDWGQTELAVLSSAAIAASLLWQHELLSTHRRARHRCSCWPLLLVLLTVGAVLLVQLKSKHLGGWPTNDVDVLMVVASFSCSASIGWLLLCVSVVRLPLLTVATTVSTAVPLFCFCLKFFAGRGDHSPSTRASYSSTGDNQSSSGVHTQAFIEAQQNPLWVNFGLAAVGQLMVATNSSQWSHQCRRLCRRKKK